MASNAKLVRRSQRVAFYGIPGDSGADPENYTRMEHFTSLSEAKNPVTYERQYVDKDSSDSDVTGYGTALSYGFDHHSGDEVLKDLAMIQDDELRQNVGLRANKECDRLKLGYIADKWLLMLKDMKGNR